MKTDETINQRAGKAAQKEWPKAKYICVGGPFDGQAMWLSKSNPSTVEFSLHGMRGRYLLNRETSGSTFVEWKENGK